MKVMWIALAALIAGPAHAAKRFEGFYSVLSEAQKGRLESAGVERNELQKAIWLLASEGAPRDEIRTLQTFLEIELRAPMKATLGNGYGNASDVTKVELENGLVGLFREDQISIHGYDREVLAYQMDRYLGFDLVPVTVFRRFKGTFGSFQVYITKTDEPRFARPDRLAVFDCITYNSKGAAYSSYRRVDIGGMSKVFSVNNNRSFDPDRLLGRNYRPYCGKDAHNHAFLATHGDIADRIHRMNRDSLNGVFYRTLSEIPAGEHRRARAGYVRSVRSRTRNAAEVSRSIRWYERAQVRDEYTILRILDQAGQLLNRPRI